MKCQMPDCAEKLDHGYHILRITTERLDEKIRKLKICKKCFHRDPVEIMQALSGGKVKFTKEEKEMIQRRTVFGGDGITRHERVIFASSGDKETRKITLETEER